MNAGLIPREIDRTKLPKRALNILEKYDPYIDHFNQCPNKPENLKLFPEDYRFLAEKMKGKGQDIKRTTYRGYSIKKYVV